MYVTGIGKTKFGVSDKNIAQLSYEAMIKAVKDSGLSITDIKAIYVGNLLGGVLQKQFHINSLISSLLPGLYIPITRIENACAGGGTSFYQAMLALSKYDHVLVLGVEKMTGFSPSIIAHKLSFAGDTSFDQKSGAIEIARFALIAKEYMVKYGVTEDDLALESLKAHQNANLNPLAHFYHKEVSFEMIKNSPVICSPFRLFHCSPISDGAAAVILSREKRSSRDIKILSSSLKSDSISIVQRKDITTFPAVKLAAKEAFREAKLSPQDIDIVEVHDGVTIAGIIAVEDLGFCKPGEWKNLIRNGTTTLQGSLPINTGGGLKAGGHPIGATGVSQICELVTQLRDEAGARQVKNARTGLAHNIGGIGGTAVVTILQKQQND